MTDLQALARKREATRLRVQKYRARRKQNPLRSGDLVWVPHPERVIEPCFVYIVCAADSEDGPVKVGISVEPRQRLASIQTGSPVKLKCARAIEHRSREDARRCEAKFHEATIAHRAVGEWVFMSVAEAAVILAGQK